MPQSNVAIDNGLGLRPVFGKIFSELLAPLLFWYADSIVDELEKIGRESLSNTQLLKIVHGCIVTECIAFEVIDEKECDEYPNGADPYQDAICIRTSKHNKGDKVIVLLCFAEPLSPATIARQFFVHCAQALPHIEKFTLSALHPLHHKTTQMDWRDMIHLMRNKVNHFDNCLLGSKYRFLESEAL